MTTTLANTPGNNEEIKNLPEKAISTQERKDEVTSTLISPEIKEFNLRTWEFIQKREIHLSEFCENKPSQVVEVFDRKNLPMFTPTGYNLITSNIHSDKYFIINNVTTRDNGRLVIHGNLEDAGAAAPAEEELGDIGFSFDIRQISNYLPETKTQEEGELGVWESNDNEIDEGEAKSNEWIKQLFSDEQHPDRNELDDKINS